MNEQATGASKQSVTEDDAKAAAARAVASVLDLPGIADVAEAMVEPFGKALLALVEPLDSVSSSEGTARKLLDVAVSQAVRGPGVQEIIEREKESGEPEAPTPDPTPPPWPQIISRLVEELAEHVAAEDMELRRDARAALRELGAEVTGLRAFLVTGPGGDQWSKDIERRVAKEIANRAAKLKKVMERLDRIFGKISAPRFRLALQLLRAELIGGLPDRAVIGLSMSVPGFLADLAVGADPSAEEARSSLSIGTEVHEYLQREYRSFWTSPRLIGRSATPWIRAFVVQDSVVYYNVMIGSPLDRAAKTRQPPDGSLWALLYARLPEDVVGKIIGNKPRDHVWSMYREDTLDMRIGEVWEIKPMRSAAIGVYQEMQYRHAFNLVNALMLDVRDILATGPAKGVLRKRAAFFKGLSFSRELPLIGGLDQAWAPIKRAFVLQRKKGQPLLVVPMTVPQLPGLLLYVLLRVPAELLFVFSALLAKTIAEQLEKIARDYAKFVEQVLQALAQLALALLASVAVLVVVAFFWEALAGGAAAARALAALAELIARFAPALGASLVPSATSTTDEGSGPASGAAPGESGSLLKKLMDMAQQEKLKLLVPPRVVGEELVVQLAPVEQRGGSRMPVIDVAVGNVRVCGLPASARPIVDALAQIGVTVAAGVFTEFLGKKKGQV
jgi:hypothetical protein